jgi:phosphonate degradation associated HDIG domain protein
VTPAEGRDAFAALTELFDAEGGREYLGEDVSMAQHMLQTAQRAREARASRALVVAALVHDVGHFTGAVSGQALMAGTDNHHDEVAASWLGAWFGHEVTEPVRLHVLAKRYLCAVDPAYFEQLSDASKRTMEVQGGPMSTQEADQFSHQTYAGEAVELRRWDDQAKNPAVGPLSLEEFRDDIEALDRTLERSADGTSR